MATKTKKTPAVKAKKSARAEQAPKASPAPAKVASLTVASVERALEVLNAFADSNSPLTLADLSARTGLYKSTIIRLADTLTGYDYLVRLEDGTYQIGPQPFLLGARYQSGVIPLEVVMPVLKNLVAETGESAAFNVRQGDYRVCLWRVDSPHLIRDHRQPGDVRPLGQGVAGRLLLAFSREDDPQYAELRRNLIAHSYGEVEAEMAGVGAPVFSADGQVRGVLTLSGPRSRFGEDKIRQMERLLLEAAGNLTKRIGGKPDRFKEVLEAFVQDSRPRKAAGAKAK